MWRAYHTKRPFSLKRALFFSAFSSCVFLHTFFFTPFSSHLFVKRCCQKLLGDTAYLRPTLLSLKGGLWRLGNLGNLGNLGSLGSLGYLRSLRLSPLLLTPPSPKLGEDARRRESDAFVRVVLLKVKTQRTEGFLCQKKERVRRRRSDALVRVVL